MDEIEEPPARLTPVAVAGTALTGGLETTAGPLAVRAAAPTAGLAEAKGARLASPEIDARGRTTDPAGLDVTESVGEATAAREGGGLVLVDAARGLVGAGAGLAGASEARLAATVPGAAAVTPGRVTVGGFAGGVAVDFLSADTPAAAVGGFATVDMPSLGLAASVVAPKTYISMRITFRGVTELLSPHLLHGTVCLGRSRTFRSHYFLCNLFCWGIKRDSGFWLWLGHWWWWLVRRFAGCVRFRVCGWRIERRVGIARAGL